MAAVLMAAILICVPLSTIEISENEAIDQLVIDQLAIEQLAIEQLAIDLQIIVQKSRNEESISLDLLQQTLHGATIHLLLKKKRDRKKTGLHRKTPLISQIRTGETILGAPMINGAKTVDAEEKERKRKSNIKRTIDGTIGTRGSYRKRRTKYDVR